MALRLHRERCEREKKFGRTVYERVAGDSYSFTCKKTKCSSGPVIKSLVWLPYLTI